MQIRTRQKIITALFVSLFCTVFSRPAATAATYQTFEGDPQVASFIEDMSKRHRFEAETLTGLFAKAQKRDDILKAISRPAEKKPWYEYRPIFLTQSRIDGGVNFWQQNARILKKAEKKYGVDASVIVAIVGVETRYGGNTGSHRVIDALSTLAFAYPPRSKFFTGELEQFLLLSRDEHIKLDEVKGSYAGAMGLGQFIPSSYRRYAVDMDGDGKRDLWDSMEDILGSVANYLSEHGWQLNQPVARLAELSAPAESLVSDSLKPAHNAGYFSQRGVKTHHPLPADMPAALLALETSNGHEYWLTTNNFYVITRYNRSPLYAMAVYQLSEAVRDAYQREDDDD